MSDNKRLKNYDDLPLVLDVADIRRIMGISRVSAYELVHTPGFPAFRSGRLIKVSKKVFFDWMAKGYGNRTERQQMSAWYLSLSGILPPFSKAHTEGKNLENDTETLHQNRLSAYVG